MFTFVSAAHKFPEARVDVRDDLGHYTGNNFGLTLHREQFGTLHREQFGTLHREQSETLPREQFRTLPREQFGTLHREQFETLHREQFGTLHREEQRMMIQAVSVADKDLTVFSC